MKRRYIILKWKFKSCKMGILSEKIADWLGKKLRFLSIRLFHWGSIHCPRCGSHICWQGAPSRFKYMGKFSAICCACEKTLRENGFFSGKFDSYFKPLKKEVENENSKIN